MEYFIKDPSDFDNIKFKTKDSFRYICKKCNKIIYNKKFYKSRLKSYKNMKCTHCTLTNKINYGYEIEINLNNINLIYSLVSNHKIKYKCVNCGNIVHTKISFKRLYNIQKLKCERCIQSENHKLHPEWQKKSLESNIKNHNGMHNMQTEEGIRKIQESMRHNFNGLLFCQTETFRQNMSRLHKMNPEWQKNLASLILKIAMDYIIFKRKK